MRTAAILLLLVLLALLVYRWLGSRPRRTVRRRGATPVSEARTEPYMCLGAELVVERGPDLGRRYSLSKPLTFLGRAGTRKNDVELTDTTVSKEQATIYYDALEGRFLVKDEGATNPTLVDGEPVVGEVRLEPGSLVEAGKTALRLREL